MNETVQNAADSAVAPAPAAAPVAEEAVQQPAIVASEPAAKVKGKFDEQLGLMLPSDAAQVQAQLSMPGMSDDMVYKIVETHGGNHAVLYKTYDQAVLARDVRDSIENAAGHKVLPIAKAKLGTTYCKGEYSTEPGHRPYRGDVRHRGPHGALLPHELHHGEARPQQDQGSGPRGQGCSGCRRCSEDDRPGPLRLGSERQERPPTNKQLQAFLGIAAVAALEEHPGMTNDQFLALVTAAATQAIGQPCRVTAYRNINSPAWTIVK